MSTYFRKSFNISVDQNDISSYLREIQKFPILTHENEIKLANEWIKSKSSSAAHQLINSHLRLSCQVSNEIQGVRSSAKRTNIRR